MNTKLVAIAFSFLLFTACKNTESQTSHDVVEEMHEDHHGEADHHEHGESGMDELALNNGAKWMSDESTELHGKNLVEIAKNYEKQEDKSLEASHAYANEVEQEMAQLIQKCTMKGPDHDALHLWLEPILKDVKSLKESQDEVEATKTAHSLTEGIVKYPDYFTYAN